MTPRQDRLLRILLEAALESKSRLCSCCSARQPTLLPGRDLYGDRQTARELLDALDAGHLAQTLEGANL